MYVMSISPATFCVGFKEWFYNPIQYKMRPVYVMEERNVYVICICNIRYSLVI